MHRADISRSVTGDQYRFVCASCGERFRTDAEMRAVLIEEGCVICGARVTGAEFTVT